MPDTRLSLTDEAASFERRALWFLALGAAAAAVAIFVPMRPLSVVLVAFAATLAAAGAFLIVAGLPATIGRRRRIEALRDLCRHDRRPVCLTDGAGRVLWTNGAGDIEDYVSRDLASPAEALGDLASRARSEGSAERWMDGRLLSVQRTGPGDLLWRLTAPPKAPETEAPAISLESLPVPIMRVCRTGKVQEANHAARALLRLEEGEEVMLSSLVDSLGRTVTEWIEDAFKGISLSRPEVCRATRSENDAYVQIKLEPMGRERDCLMAVLQDATQLKTLEQQVVQSQKMQAIGQLAGGIAHDFNNLLTAIRGHCELLLLRHDVGDPDFPDLEQINQNANRAASLVGQLLAFSRKQTLRLESISLVDLMSDLTHLLDRLTGEKIAFELTHAADLPLVRADRRQLEQVIMNLVVNARDAMPSGGRVTLTTESRRIEAPLLRNRARVGPGDYVEVRVEDEGTGIPPEVLEKIFEPFFTTKKVGEGTGLGLSTVYGIVKQTGGYIFVDSTPGEGTVFTLLLPADRAGTAAPEPVKPAAREVAPKGGGTILLVEDEAPVRALASRALTLQGYDVVEAENGEAALEIAGEAGRSFDLFVSDVIMPGLDGPGWVSRALKLHPDVPVVFMSGYAEESFSGEKASIEGSLFLQKPFSLVDLAGIAKRALDARRK